MIVLWWGVNFGLVGFREWENLNFSLGSFLEEEILVWNLSPGFGILGEMFLWGGGAWNFIDCLGLLELMF